MAGSSLRKLRNEKGLSLEQTARSLTPPMSWRTLLRWEKEGVPVRRDENRDNWIEQLADLYEVDAKELTPNGRAA